MTKVCAWCQMNIENMSSDTTHIHHDLSCDYNPYYHLNIDPQELEAMPDKITAIMDEYSSLMIEHDLLCEKQIYYHVECCRKCGQLPVGV